MDDRGRVRVKGKLTTGSEMTYRDKKKKTKLFTWEKRRAVENNKVEIVNGCSEVSCKMYIKGKC